MEKIKFTFIKNNFSFFLDRLSDLTDLGENIKITIDKENIFMFSTIGERIMLGFKNFLLKTDDYLTTEDDLEKPVSMVIVNAKRFIKNLKFLEREDKISLDIIIRPSHIESDYIETRALQIKGGKLKINWIGGEEHNMGPSVNFITKEFINNNLILKNRNWSFTINTDDYNDVVQLANNNPINVVNIDVNDGEVIFSQTAAWELKVSDTTKKKENFVFNKRFFKCIDKNVDEIEFNLFDNFILLKGENSNLMLSYEQNFSDGDI